LLCYFLIGEETRAVFDASTDLTICKDPALGCLVGVKERNPCLDDLLIKADMKRLNFNCAFNFFILNLKSNICP
jgi:hypothetical protein